MTRVALIAGGARGVGRACAIDLASRGWRVAVAWRSSADDARALADALGAAHRVDRCDLEDPDAREAWISTCERALGAVDALVYSAGPFHRAEIDQDPDEGWRRCFEGNLHAPRATALRVLPGMRARGWGRVVLFGMASSSRLAPPPALAAYHGAKAALTAWARAAAVSVAAEGVTVNVVAPGVIDTDGMDRAIFERMASRVPAGRAGRAEEVAAAVRFLLSDEAGYVNGAELAVSGAWGL